MKNAMDDFDRLRWDEHKAKVPHTLDVGVGLNAAEVTGWPMKELSDMAAEEASHPAWDRLENMVGKIAVEASDNKEVILLYLTKCGCLVNLGTRQDMQDIGLEEVCDFADNLPMMKGVIPRTRKP